MDHLNDQDFIRDVLRRIAVGPRMSKDLSRAEAARATALLLAGKLDPVQAGIFLIALRMKRETDDENLGVLDALQAANCRHPVAVPDLLEVTDPFNGVDRQLHLTPFLAPTLAACGLPTVLHACRDVGPKHGVTAHEVLAAAGQPLPASVNQVATELAAPDRGWSYLDLSQSCPALDQLVPLRELIVKRTCLSTLEKLMRPLHAADRTHMLTGYVHRGYPGPLLTIAAAAGYHTALVLRGTGGSVIPPLARGLETAFLHADGTREIAPLAPQTFGIDSQARFLPAPPSDGDRAACRRTAAAQAAAAGLAALRGEAGDAADLLTFAAAAALSHATQIPPAAAITKVRQALASGAALKRFS